MIFQYLFEKLIKETSLYIMNTGIKEYEIKVIIIIIISIN